MKYRKIVVSTVVLILIFFSFTNVVQASLFTKEETSEIEETIDKDEGGLFEKVIAKMIRGNCRNSF